MAFVCEICGGTEIIKQEGTFVCQGCGMKYSAEEVRKMMTGGTIDVSGSTVKVDTSQKLKNLKQLAHRAKENNDSDAAAKYYEQIMLEDPNDWEASFYSVYYAAHNIKLSQMASGLNKVRNCLDTVFHLIHDNVPENEWEPAYLEVINAALAYNNLMFANIDRVGVSNIFDSSSELHEFFEAGDLLRFTCADGVDNIFHDYVNAEKLYKTVTKSEDKERDIDKIVEKRLKVLEEASRQQAIKQKRERNEKYWAEHQEEKAALDETIKVNNEKLVGIEQDTAQVSSEIDQHNRKLKDLTSSIEKKKATIAHYDSDAQSQTQSELAIKKINDDINRLQSQMHSLGLFKGKEKKALQEQIDALTAKRSSLQRNIPGEKDEARRKADELKKPIQAEIDSLNAQVSEARKQVQEAEKRLSEIKAQADKLRAEVREAQAKLDADH